jgi:hypothetical protein
VVVRRNRFCERLQKDLSTFTEPIPANNHIPWIVKERTGKFPGPTLEEEYSLVTSFLRLYQPIFTWNGDTTFWKSAANAVGSAMNLLWRVKTAWTIDEATKLTNHCLEFLIKVGNLLPESTVGFSPDEEFDVLVVTPNELKWVSRSKLPSSLSERRVSPHLNDGKLCASLNNPPRARYDTHDPQIQHRQLCRLSPTNGHDW